MTGTLLSVTVYSEDGNIIMKAAEVFARAAVGLALDGVNISTSITSVDIEEDDE